MQHAFWEYLKTEILATLTGPVSAGRVFYTVFYAFLTAVILLATGFFIHLIEQGTAYNTVIPYVIIFCIGLILAFLNNIYDKPSAGTVLAGTLGTGIVFCGILLLLAEIFPLVKLERWSLLAYVWYVLIITGILSVLYWIVTDRIAGERRAAGS
ncbi:MAG TPA: hypothetical protein P5217_09185 [Methanoregulaceae archaeon]|nr:hypothetical protein [Methanoregulaceae archaeon]HPD76349.1 hypothetical protein [Methanoregulaceae archaeon]HRY76444.1 hypothetical protein [Methanoregulaceae archaeon]